MPTYVYECSSCGKRFEAIQSMSAAPLDSCSLCGKQGTVKRVIQPVGIAFKGSGFYVNDSVPSAPSSPAAETPKAESTPVPATPESAAPSTPSDTTKA